MTSIQENTDTIITSEIHNGDIIQSSVENSINPPCNNRKSELELILEINDLSNMEKDVLKKIKKILVYNDYQIVQNNIFDLSKIGVTRLEFWINQFENRNESIWRNSDAFGFAGLFFGIGTLISNFEKSLGVFTGLSLIILLALLGVSVTQVFQIPKKRECNRILFFLESALTLAKENNIQ